MDVVRANLKPVLRNLPGPVHQAAIALLGKTCHKKLLINVDLGSQECLKLAVSKLLGVGIVGASAVVKVPQILKLVSSGSAAGISFLSYVLETAAFVIGLAYNARQGFPFSTYGETALIAAQNVVIAALVLQFRGRGAAAATFVAGLAAAVYALLFAGDRFVDMKGLGYLQAGAGLLSLASKAPQIWTIYREGGTGQLSAFAVFNYLAGSLTRIYTTLQEVDDRLILWGFIAGFFLNAVLAAQMVYYWNSPGSQSNTLTPSKRSTKGKSKKRSKQEPGLLRSDVDEIKSNEIEEDRESVNRILEHVREKNKKKASTSRRG